MRNVLPELDGPSTERKWPLKLDVKFYLSRRKVSRDFLGEIRFAFWCSRDHLDWSLNLKKLKSKNLISKTFSEIPRLESEKTPLEPLAKKGRTISNIHERLK